MDWTDWTTSDISRLHLQTNDCVPFVDKCLPHEMDRTTSSQRMMYKFSDLQHRISRLHPVRGRKEKIRLHVTSSHPIGLAYFCSKLLLHTRFKRGEERKIRGSQSPVPYSQRLRLWDGRTLLLALCGSRLWLPACC